MFFLLSFPPSLHPFFCPFTLSSSLCLSWSLLFLSLSFFHPITFLSLSILLFLYPYFLCLPHAFTHIHTRKHTLAENRSERPILTTVSLSQFGLSQNVNVVHFLHNNNSVCVCVSARSQEKVLPAAQNVTEPAFFYVHQYVSSEEEKERLQNTVLQHSFSSIHVCMSRLEWLSPCIKNKPGPNRLTTKPGFTIRLQVIATKGKSWCLKFRREGLYCTIRVPVEPKRLCVFL